MEDKKVTLRPLTKYQQDMMLRARQKHKTNITKQQTCWGKTFKGAAFIPKPQKILFKDFEVGQSYTLTLILTNVSFTFNSFKLLPIDLQIKDFFLIQFKPPGRMSAGLTCKIKITFTPQVNQDIISVFPILSQTGPIDIPLQCYSKKSQISFDSYSLNFSDVILGQQGTQKLVVKNDGALWTSFRITKTDGEIIPHLKQVARGASSEFDSMSQSDFLASKSQGELDPESFFAMMRFPRSGEVKGYSSTVLSFTFEPQIIGEYFEEVLFNFGNTLVPPINLQIIGRCIDVPIYVEQETYDLQVCVIGHTYRQKIMLWNRSNVPMKFQLTFPKYAKDFFEFNPTLGYIQGKDKFQIWCKIRPEQNIYKILADFQQSPNVFSVPITVTGANQVMPVPFNIKFQATTDTVIIDPPQVNFGDVFINQGVLKRIYLKSQSSLPQEFAFVRLPPTITFEPNDGFGTLLPYEELEMHCIYRPAPVKAGTQLGKDIRDIYLRVKTGTLTAREYRIPYRAKLLNCPIQLSSSKLQFPVLQEGRIIEEIITITNVSRKIPYDIEICAPALSGLIVTPKVITKLHLGKPVRVLLRYKAEFRYPSVNQQEKLQNEEENSVEEPVEQEEDYTELLKAEGGKMTEYFKEDELKRSQHYDWLIPVYFRPVVHDSVVKKTFIQLRTTVVNKSSDEDGGIPRSFRQ